MSRFTLLPSVNWNVSHMLMINEAGTVCAYGSRGDIVIIRNVHQGDISELKYKFIPRAHKNNRVTGLVFVKQEIEGHIVESLASCGDDGHIKVWDYESGINTHKFNAKKAFPEVKFVDIDFFPQTESIVSANEQKHLMRWNLPKNKVNVYYIETKIIMTCVVICPHEEDLVAIGARSGLVLIYSMKGEGKLRHKIRCHDSDVYSVSWCPVPYNTLQLFNLQKDETFNENEWKNKDKTYLLASCSKDRSIYICKAGTNGYCETVLTLPPKPIIPTSSNLRFFAQHSNFERGRYIRWIYPLSLITFTDFNEMVILNIVPKPERRSINKQIVSNVKVEVKPIHSVHQRSISNFGVHLVSKTELNFKVWSCSVDRLLVRGGYKGHCKEKPLVLPLMGGYVFSLDISPTTFDRLAIGTGDGKICLWDLSNENSIDITTLSKKIDNKVMSLKWHPYEEGILAFGTYEGRVGIFDISMGSKTTSWLFKVYHHKPIYKLCWAPPIFLDADDGNKKSIFRGNLYLFAVGNGDILQFNPNDMNKMPVSLSSEVLAAMDEVSSCKFKTDLCLERDRKAFAVGLNNGDVCIVSSTSHSLQYVIKEQPKSIMALAWHPRIILDSPKEVSPYSSWLATAGENVFVYSVDEEGKSPPNKIASLELHSSRILDVAWNPHTNGRLLSCSADNTAIIWDVINQTVIGRYTEHCAQILCGVWSLTNKDIVITGSSDFTCRMWSVSRNTVASIKEKKKNVGKVVEPSVVNASPSSTQRGDTLPTSTTAKTNKVDTFLPSIIHDVHACPLLENTIREVIHKHKKDTNDVTNLSTSVISNSSVTQESIISNSELLTCTEESYVYNGNINEAEVFLNNIIPVKDQTGSENELDSLSFTEECHFENQDELKRRKNKNSIDSICNYSQLFGTREQLVNLVTHEECVLENANSNNIYVLLQARHELKAKITEAIEKNQVTKYMLTLATSISPKLWKDACQVYIEQLIQSEQIMEAVSYQLALGKDEEAISMLCDRKRYKEAFTIARLRFEDDTIAKEVLGKWIHFCFTCGLYKLGAHCHIFLNEEEKAATLLSKSKVFKDIILAAKLLKFYQPERAAELAIDGFKRHLLHLRQEDVQHLWFNFPEIKFMEPWYLSLKYLKNEKPNTAAITKWLVGLSNSDADILMSAENTDFEKLQNMILDNNFDMNFEELMIYVSAQVALYVCGVLDARFKHAALRHYLRGLLYCYNYRTIHSNQIQSDSAYPMMRLLSLIFRSGLLTDFSIQNELDSISAQLQKSINAYFCDFTVTWLIGCEQLSKSLKMLEQSSVCNPKNEVNMSNFNSYENVRNDSTCDEVLQNETKMNSTGEVELLTTITSSFAIITDNKTKLKKIDSIMTLFLNDVLDVEVVQYLQNVVILKQFDSGSTSGQVSHDWGRGLINGDIVRHSFNVSRHSKSPLDGVGLSSTDVKELRAAVEKFEKERVSSPNPYIFYCKVREYLNTNKEIDVELVTKLEIALANAAKICGISKD